MGELVFDPTGETLDSRMVSPRTLASLDPQHLVDPRSDFFGRAGGVRVRAAFYHGYRDLAVNRQDPVFEDNPSGSQLLLETVQAYFTSQNHRAVMPAAGLGAGPVMRVAPAPGKPDFIGRFSRGETFPADIQGSSVRGAVIYDHAADPADRIDR